MFRLFNFLACLLLFTGGVARAAYAPVPETDEGKDLIVKVRASVAHDSNLFGAASGAISTAVYTLAPGITWNRSVTEQTFFSASYGLTLDRFDRRPGDKLLDSHDATLRLAHAFSQATVLDLNNAFMIGARHEIVRTLVLRFTQLGVPDVLVPVFRDRLQLRQHRVISGQAEQILGAVQGPAEV
ncbi:MAG: hypothetical protein ACKOTE_01575, partial [Opitutaceae bacterium]